MRFDDSLATVLAADTATDAGAVASWRQLVDLVGRARVRDEAAAVAKLRELREQVPTAVRVASARALAGGEPAPALIRLFAEDEPGVAASLLREATLPAAEWLALLPRLSPATRAVLRHRRDLPAEVVRGLASFGAADFVLGHEGAAPDAPPAPASTAAVNEIARVLPPAERIEPGAGEPPRFEIADLVARIDAARRDRTATPAPVAPPPAAERFRFGTDALGVIRWVDGVARGPLVGVTLARSASQGVVRIDAAPGHALRDRSAFRDVRLEIAGQSSAAGSWRLAATPRFDRASGGFAGLVGVGRRHHQGGIAAPRDDAVDSLRQLVHELRTPANAIAGFSELIGTELLGPVPPVYRDRAIQIGRETAGLVAAIDDLDTAARLQSDALDLRTGVFDLGALLARRIAELRPIAADRRVALSIDAERQALVQADERALERLLDRLLGTLTAVGEPGERLRVQVVVKTRFVRLHVTRPRALPTGDDRALLAIDADDAAGPLLGVGFTLRLVRNLAAALGGSLAITPDRLTLRLPVAQPDGVEQAKTQ